MSGPRRTWTRVASRGGIEFEYRAGHVLLQLKRGRLDEKKVLARLFETIDHRIADRDDARWLDVQVDADTDIPALIDRLDPADLAWAEPDVILSPALEVDDELLRSGEQWSIDFLRLPEAWDLQRGNDTVLIGLLDSGIPLGEPPAGGGTLGADLSQHVVHLDLKGREFLAGPSYPVGDEAMTLWPDDGHGHGTNLAGILAAVTDNEKGIAGVNHFSPVYVANIMPDGTSSVGLVLRGLRDLFDYAAGHGNPNVVVVLCLVLETDRRFDPVGFPYRNAMRQIFEKVLKAPAILCVAGGNGTDDFRGDPWVALPAALGIADERYRTRTVAVGAVGATGDLWWASARGPEDFVYAPGDGVVTTSRNAEDAYTTEYGTSEAGAHVGGVASLMWSHAPGASPDAIVRCLKCATRRPYPKAEHRVLDARLALDLLPGNATLLPPSYLLEDLEPGHHQLGMVEIEVWSCAPVTFRITIAGHSFGIHAGLYRHDPCLNRVFQLPLAYLADDPILVEGSLVVEWVERPHCRWEIPLRGSRRPSV